MGIINITLWIPHVSETNQDNTMAFVYNSASQGLSVLLRMAGQTNSLELANERALGTTVTANVALAVTHRNRFTQVVSASPVTVTVSVYSGILLGSEHEFMNNGTSTVTFTADAGVTVRSVGSKSKVVQFGAAVLKYLGSSTFALIGALE